MDKETQDKINRVAEDINVILKKEKLDLAVQPYFQHVGDGSFVIKVNQFLNPTQDETPSDKTAGTEPDPAGAKPQSTTPTVPKRADTNNISEHPPVRRPGTNLPDSKRQ